MKFIRIITKSKKSIFYQTNQLIKVEQTGIKTWLLTFSDNKQYNIKGEDYFFKFEFLNNSDKQVYDYYEA